MMFLDYIEIEYGFLSNNLILAKKLLKHYHLKKEIFLK